MNDPKHDPIKEKAEELRRRLEYTPESQKTDRDSLKPPPANLPEKKASAFLATVLELFKEGGVPNVLAKTGHDLTAGERKELPKNDFAVSSKKSNTGKPAYPIPDAQHARSALGFAKMHGDEADIARVRAKVEAKYPDLVKKAGFFQRMGQSLAGEKGTHAAELAGLGVLAVPGIDALQAHGRALAAGDHNKAGVKKRELLPHAAKPLAETAGLGILAAPSIAHLVGH